MNYLDDCERTLKSMVTKNDFPITFKPIKNVTISALNSLLREMARSTLSFRLQVDFSRNDSKTSEKGFFQENGLIEMLEALDFIKVDQLSLFLGSVVDLLCGKESRAEVTAVFTLYVEFISFFFRRRLISFWASGTLSELDEKRKEFKKKKKKFV